MSMENKDLPAFPIMDANGFPAYAEAILKNDKPIVAGLTKREYIAAMAMQGILTGMGQPLVHPSEYRIGQAAVAFADDLLQELSKTPNP